MKSQRTKKQSGAADLFATKRWLAPLMVAVLLAVLAIEGVWFIRANSQTNDEVAHIGAGYSYLVTRDFRLNPEHPPLIKEICALPLLALNLRFPWGRDWDLGDQWTLGKRFVHEQAELWKEQTGRDGPAVPNDTILFWGRVPVLLISIVFGWLFYLAGSEMFGVRTGLLALALYVLDPNVVAHSCLITTDLGVMVFTFLAVYRFCKYLQRPTRAGLLWTGTLVGAAAASKFSAAWILPILLLLGSAAIIGRAPLPSHPWRAQSGPATGPSQRSVSLAGALFVVLTVAFVCLAASYFFSGLSALGKGITKAVGHLEDGHETFLLGDFSQRGWWYYFLAAFGLKTPFGTLVLLGAAVLMAIGKSGRSRRRQLSFLLVPIMTLVLTTSSMTIDIGLRHLLPLYPFLFLFTAGIAESDPESNKSGVLISGLIVLCVAWNCREALWIAPYDLAYFNQFAGGPDRGFGSLADSNLDWGQSNKALKKYMDQRGLGAIYCAFAGNPDPWYYGIRYQYVPGPGNLEKPKTRGFTLPRGSQEILAVTATILQGLHLSNHDAYAWLRTRRPIAILGHSIYVYDITGDETAHLNIAYGCRGYKLYHLAAHEAQRALEINPSNTLAKELLQSLPSSSN